MPTAIISSGSAASCTAQPQRLTLACSHGFQLQLAALSGQRFRVSLLRGPRRTPSTYAIASPRGAPTPLEGLCREALLAEFEPDGVAATAESIADGPLSAELKSAAGSPPQLLWRYNGSIIAEDFAPGSYCFDGKGGVQHFMARGPPDREFYYGVGEAAGPINRYGGRFRLGALDALGYEADPRRGLTDPLYKHYPMYITLVVDDKGQPVGAYGIFYDNLSRGVLDFGEEVSAFRGSYRYAAFEDGDLEYYIVFGQDISAVVSKLSGLIGLPPPAPLWVLGYLGSTMAYTEAPNAQERLAEFASLCRLHKIPCDGFHMSSGYTCVDAADGTGFGPRCVFNWNSRRVPSPEAMFKTFTDAGINVLPNIKPWLLKDYHPRYQELANLGGFVRTSATTAAPHRGLFWAGGEGSYAVGSYIDFANATGYNWWVAACKTALLQRGATALWNDNNEFEIDDDEAVCGSAASPQPVSQMRPVQTLLMAKASRQALEEVFPDRRAVVISRSGCPGLQRYCVQTWSGDNRTCWRTLQWNTPMGLSLGLCGWPGNGHDIGGFKGPMPDPELFVRWVQSSVCQPRFCIHSWNDGGTCTEPWSHPQALSAIRQAIRFRYSLLPYLYALQHNASATGLPLTRPLVFAFPEDGRVRTDALVVDDGLAEHGEREFSGVSPYIQHAASCDYMLGDSLLIAPIYTPGAVSRPVYLPGGSNTLWCEWRTEKWYAGGSVVPEVVCSVGQGLPIIFVRDGSLIGTYAEDKEFRNCAELKSTEVQLQLFMRNATSARCVVVDDDGDGGNHGRRITVEVTRAAAGGASVMTHVSEIGARVAGSSGSVELVWRGEGSEERAFVGGQGRRIRVFV